MLGQIFKLLFPSWIFGMNIDPITATIIGGVAAGGTGFGLNKLFGGGGGDGASNAANDLSLAMGGEKLQAMRNLQDFSKTGTLGPFTAGTPYTGDLGSYEMTGAESLGQNQLMQLLLSGLPETFTQGRDIISDYVNSDFDPQSESGLFKPYKTQVRREQAESSDLLDRELALTGDLFSTARGKEQGLLAERGQQALTSKLAELFDTAQQRKLAGAESLANMGLSEEDLMTKRIGLSQSLGSLQRLLKDQEAKDKLSEFTRQRGELSTVLDAAKTVAGAGGYSAGGSSAAADTSPFTKILETGLALAGKSVANKIETGSFFGPGSGSGSGTSNTGSYFASGSAGTIPVAYAGTTATSIPGMTTYIAS